MPKLHVNFLLVKKSCVEQFECKIQIKKCFNKGLAAKPLQLHHAKEICLKWILQRCMEWMHPIWCNLQ